MYKYQYIGKNAVEVKGIGLVRPNYIFKTDIAIIHPNFVRLDNKPAQNRPAEQPVLKSKGKKRRK